MGRRGAALIATELESPSGLPDSTMTPGELLKPRIERIAERASFVTPASRLVAAVLAGVLLAGCDRSDPEPRRSVAVRLTDLLYERTSPVPGSTVWYPRATVGEQTRPVLSAAQEVDTLLSRSHGRLQVHVPRSARMDVGVGVHVLEKLPAPVIFEITATVDGEARRLFEIEVGAADVNRWHDAVVSFDSLNRLDSDVTLEFTSSSTVLGTDASGRKNAVAYFSEPVLTTSNPHATGKPPNVILMSLDTLRADRLGIYGYGRATTPNMDRIFSTEGLVVERFYANAADTLHAHAAMFTGYLPTTALLPRKTLPAIVPRTTLLSESLRAAGWRTAAFTEDAWVGADFGFARGFELYDEEVGVEGLADTAGYIEQTFERGLQWIERHAAEPFFLFLHTYQVHSPYEPPARYMSSFDPPPTTQPAVDAARYDAEILFTDEQVGRFVDALSGLGVLDSTLLVVTSDHGEEFGEHGRREHGTHLYEESVRVPLLMRAPGLLPAGARRSGPMATVDLVPTLAALLGLETSGERDGENFSAHLVEGAAADPVAIYHEARTELSRTYEGLDPTWMAPSFAVTAWPRRLIRIRTPEGARYELYDLEADPAERTNLWTGNEKKLGFLRARLDRYDEFRSRRRAALAPRPSTPPAGAPAAAASHPDAQGTAMPRTGGLDPQRERKLRALGYIE